MGQAELKNKTDFLDLPDDELPDYPPDDISEGSADASDEAEEVTLTDEDEENDDTINAEVQEQTGSSSEGESQSSSTESRDEEGALESGREASQDSGEGQDEGEEELTSPEASQEASDQSKPMPKGKGTKQKTAATEEEVLSTSAETQLKQLFAPFRANGKDMQVSSIDDAMTLMKMGANYNKKMAGLKPNLKLMKMLDNNKLLDEQKLSYLIDLSNKDPKAINQLIKDSGLDPMEIDTDTPTEYKPNSYTVNDNEVALDLVLDDISDTKTFQETIDIISNKWDVSSKNVLLKKPNLIKDINDHVGNGIYSKIMGIVDNERALGRLTDLTDLEAYTQVGDNLQAQGAFNKVTSQATENPSPAAVLKAKEDPKLKNRKKAAANTRSASAKPKVQFDPLSLSDDDFEKVSATLNI